MNENPILNIYPAGRQFKASSKAVNILITGDGWAGGDKIHFEKACEKIAKRILEIEPFKILNNYINIFGAFSESAHPYTPQMSPGKYDYGVDYGGPLTDTTKTAFNIYYEEKTYPGSTVLVCQSPQNVSDFIQKLSFRCDGIEINGTFTWLLKERPDPENLSTMLPNTSFGLIGIIIPNKRAGGTASKKTIDPIVTIHGSVTEISFFMLDSWKSPVTTFAHELGHNLDLDDEYEEDESGKSPPYKYDVWSNPNNEWSEPGGINVLKKEEIVVDPQKDLSEGLSDTEIANFKWRELLSLNDKLALRNGVWFSHLSRMIEFNDLENTEIFFGESSQSDSLLTAKIPQGKYAVDQICGIVKQALESVGNNTYHVSYDENFRLTITSDGEYFNLLWAEYWIRKLAAGDIVLPSSAADRLGFSDNKNYTGALSYTAEKPFSDPNGQADKNTYKNTDYRNVILLVEGGCHVRRDVFRSNFNCIMRDNSVDGVQFCRVCYHHILQKFLGESSSDYVLGSPLDLFPKKV